MKRQELEVCYAGTYEREYPRNALIIQALLDAGVRVEEVHVPVFERLHDKSSVGVLRLIHLLVSLVVAYASLIPRVALRLRRCDALAIGYIGQFDMLVLAPIAHVMRKPVVFNPLITLTDTMVEDRNRVSEGSILARLIAIVDWIALKLADVILVDTEQNAEYLNERFAVPRDEIVVVPVGADEQVFYPEWTEQEETRPDDVLDVLFVGKFIPLHGIDTIIRSVHILERRGVPVRFELVGTGQTYAEMRLLAGSLGITTITWTDWIPFRALGRRLRRADVVLGVFDSGAKSGRVIPNKVYQSLACGVATITRSSMAADTLLTSGDNALLVAPGDPSALADAVESLVDLGRRQRVGRGGRRIYEEKASRAALVRQLQPLFRIMLEQSCRP